MSRREGEAMGEERERGLEEREFVLILAIDFKSYDFVSKFVFNFMSPDPLPIYIYLKIFQHSEIPVASFSS